MTKGNETQRKERIEQLRQQIEQGIDRLRNADMWMAYLRFMSGFHSYSLSNIMLMLGQSNGKATLVAGFRQWQAKGRQVRKGEHGMKIFGYSTRLIKDEDGNPQLDEDGTPMHTVWYPVVTVFDISQTDPVDPDNDPYTAMHPRILEGDDHGIYERCRAWVESQGWTVTREPIAGGVNGYTQCDGSRRIVIDSGLPPMQAAKTMLRETAHMLLHQDLPGEEYQEHRGLCETEAESTAYVVANYMGLDTGDYTIPYVAGWSGLDADIIQQAAQHVRDAADQIIKALDPEQ